MKKTYSLIYTMRRGPVIHILREEPAGLCGIKLRHYDVWEGLQKFQIIDEVTCKTCLKRFKNRLKKEALYVK